MSKLTLQTILFISMIGIFAASCTPGLDVPIPVSTQVISSTPLTPTQTEIQASTSEAALETPTSPAPTAALTPADTDATETADIIDSLLCVELFCQVPWEGILNRPIGADYRDSIDPTYPYASTRNGTLEVHHGVEFVNSSGTPVLAAQDGEVVYAGNDMQILMGPYYNFYGNVVILEHPDLIDSTDIFTVYAHLSAMDVAVGDQVDAGDGIGSVGASGSAVGSHLHFEVRVGQNDYAHTVNPVLWFSAVKADEGQIAMLAGKISDRDGKSVQDVSLALEKLDPDGGIEITFYAQTYRLSGVNSFPGLDENFAIPDIPPGDYRLAFVYGTLHELFFTLEPGHLGFIEFQIE